MENLIEQINERLLEIIEEFGDSKVNEAMKYSLMAGGKRIRPVMMLQVIRSYDKNYQDYPSCHIHRQRKTAISNIS